MRWHQRFDKFTRPKSKAKPTTVWIACNASTHKKHKMTCLGKKHNQLAIETTNMYMIKFKHQIVTYTEVKWNTVTWNEPLPGIVLRLHVTFHGCIPLTLLGQFCAAQLLCFVFFSWAWSRWGYGSRERSSSWSSQGSWYTLPETNFFAP